MISLLKIINEIQIKSSIPKWEEVRDLWNNLKFKATQGQITFVQKKILQIIDQDWADAINRDYTKRNINNYFSSLSPKTLYKLYQILK